MAERSIVVRLRAEVSDYLRGIRKAREETDGLGKQSAPAATSALDKMVKSARDNRQEWTTVGTAMAAAGAAITAVGVAALKTGIEYNTLQQSSRAALRTLTGSAAEANAQMDKLDEFARTSPFAKDVFIRAQQQMLGFGIEARKVIPYLDAIQNAVAAAGGSNHDIAELSRIFSQISASAKITATDLREFGNRGIDAAALIGSQMGMTGAQIRESITAGTLDAQQALDALAAGMAERFEGASANIKDTAVGAFDRVKAAWRDLSAELAAPLVDPEGGGLLVDWLNSLADAMRDFQSLPGPVKATVAALGGLAGVSLTLAGGAMILVPRLVELYDALGKLGPAGERAQRGMAGLGRSLPGLGLALGTVAAGAVLAGPAFDALGDAIQDAVHGAPADIAKLERSLRGLAQTGIATGEAVRIFGEGMRGLDSTLGEFSGIEAAAGKVAGLTRTLSNVVLPLKLVPDRFEAAERKMADLDAVLTSIVNSGDMETYAALMAEITRRAEEQGVSQERLAELLPESTSALEDAKNVAEEAAPALGAMADATDRAAERAERYAAEQEAAAQALEQWRDMVAESSGSFIDLVGGYDKVAKAAEEAGTSQENLTRDWLAEMQAQVRAQEEWADNIVVLSKRATDLMPVHMQDAANAMIDELIAMGPEGAAAVAAMRDMSDDELSEMVTLYGQKGALAAANLTREVESHRAPKMTVVLEADTSSAYGTIDRFIRTQSGRTIHVNVKGQQVGFQTGRENMIGRAQGGILPGAPSSVDNMIIRAASGEFVVNAKATQQHRQLLEAINRNALPAYAGGGYVQPRMSVPAGGSPAWSMPAPAAAPVRAGVTAGDLASALNGLTMTLVTEAGPIRAIARAEAVSTVRTAAAGRGH